jgi:ribonuclease HII
VNTRVWPTLAREEAFLAQGFERIAGVDEAGRGAWAGPVCAASVVLPVRSHGLTRRLRGVRDSKQLSPASRDRLLPSILAEAVAVGIGWADSGEVDRSGIAQATIQAMTQAVHQLNGQAEALIIDYVALTEDPIPQCSFPKADVFCLSVAAASIVAKVTRDQLMIALEDEFPGYGFARHKGYGTAAHRAALSRLGPCPLHRMTWHPMRDLVSS